jgi:2-succinyl-5-enolpyruvyl-6-hydroxy-3-cyclohexene-1-carboxylate synthase
MGGEITLDFRNLNILWASVLVETLWRLGLRYAVVCPGSRSGPLAVAFANHPHLPAIPVLDERSAAFFALGLAKQTQVATALVCTSGTAAANFFPAVIEARMSHVPLLVLTADRPPELRDCHAGQAIDQLKLYGHYPNWQAEVAVPALEPSLLSYLRQTCRYAWERSQLPVAGPVHLNVPFRDPLAPVADGMTAVWADQLPPDFWQAFFGDITPTVSHSASAFASFTSPVAHPTPWVPWQLWQNCQRGIIICGPAQPVDALAYCQAVAQLSQALQWPVLAEALSPLRNYSELNPHLVSSYDLLLRHPDFWAALAPEMVIQLGELPTSKELRQCLHQCLHQCQPKTWIIDSSMDNVDPLHGHTTCLRLEITVLASQVPAPNLDITNAYLEQWLLAEAQVQQHIQKTFSTMEWLFEGKVSWLLSQCLPVGTPLFVSNSTPIRDLEFFWQPGNSHIQPKVNRGANGIDGILSTALGVAYNQPAAVLLTGDLALLYDTNGWLLRSYWQGHLTVVLLNNNGGGIFANLPIAGYDPPFSEFFATPQNIDFAQICQTYGVEYEKITTWQQLESRLRQLPSSGLRVLEIPCDRQRDALWRQQNLAAFARGLSR